jgi:hypothetical protein
MLSLCVPGSIETPEYDPAGCVVADGVTGIGVCPSPYHRKSVYVRHAEERYTWEETVAGVNIGGAVPVRWRGCQWGCLDFLDEEGRGEGEGDADGDEDVEMNEAEEKDMGVVQLIKFAPEDYADFSQDIGQS